MKRHQSPRPTFAEEDSDLPKLTGIGEGFEPVEIRQKCNVTWDVSAVSHQEYFVTAPLPVVLTCESMVSVPDDPKVLGYGVLFGENPFATIPVGTLTPADVLPMRSGIQLGRPVDLPRPSELSEGHGCCCLGNA